MYTPLQGVSPGQRPAAHWWILPDEGAWSGSLTTASLVTPQPGRLRSIDCSILVTPSGDAPYKVILEAAMSIGKSGAEPAGLAQLNLNAAGIDVGATSHFVAVPADRAEHPVQEF